RRLRRHRAGMDEPVRSDPSSTGEGMMATTLGTENRTTSLAQGLLQELEQEAQTTRRVLERVPDNQLSWRPHAKSRTLGQLALHIAMVPGGVAELFTGPSGAQAPQFADPIPASAAELIPALDDSIAKAKRLVGRMDDAALVEPWTLMRGDREVFTVPRVALLRSIML